MKKEKQIKNRTILLWRNACLSGLVVGVCLVPTRACECVGFIVGLAGVSATFIVRAPVARVIHAGLLDRREIVIPKFRALTHRDPLVIRSTGGASAFGALTRV